MPEKKIKITFATITPESAEAGDFEETGWIDEEGVIMTPDADDREEGITAVDNAVNFLQDEGVMHSSSSPHSPGAWYSTDFETEDYSTNEEIEKSYHLYGFTAAEEREIAERLDL